MIKRIRYWTRKIKQIITHFLLRLWIKFGCFNSGIFQKSHTYCMFVGYPRSGHTLIGSLLDAHPHAVIGHELDSLKYVMEGFIREEIFLFLVKNSEQFTQTGRKWSGYQYAVPNQWNGRFSEIRVIGDKKGHGSTLWFRKGEEVLRRLRRTVKLPVKIIHVIRNPYDNITTMYLSQRKTPTLLTNTIDYYFSLCDTVQAVKRQIPKNDFFEMRHEDFISNPKKYLKDLCLFLNLEPFEDYLNDCTSIVFKSPHESRHAIDWQPNLIQEVARRIESVPYLQGYEFVSHSRTLAENPK